MKKFIIPISICLLLLPSCKPTEKGYKAAYDAALGKREALKSDIDVNIPIDAVQQVDGPQLREIDGVKVYVLNQRLKPTDDGFNLPGQYNVAVGSYKMITNCKSQSTALKQEGLEAFPAQDPDGVFYTIAGSFPTLSDAVKFSQKYASAKDRVYVGLPDSPVIIYSPK